jgi:hypothetical protein
MQSEKSFHDRVQRAEKLHITVSAFVPAYQPADAAYTLAAFTAAIGRASNANAAVDAARVPYKDKAADRAALVKSLGPLVTQSLAYVKSNTAWAKRYDAIKALADKVRGVRPPRPKVVDPAADQKTRNSGELSHAEIAAHLKRYIARLEALTGYAPPDAKISIAQLTAQLTTLTEWNQSVPALAQTLTDAIADRQESYNGPTGLKACFDGVKVSVKGQYGQTSTQYKSISGMRW